MAAQASLVAVAIPVQAAAGAAADITAEPGAAVEPAGAAAHGAAAAAAEVHHMRMPPFFQISLSQQVINRAMDS
jgi:hypothetical protein